MRHGNISFILIVTRLFKATSIFPNSIYSSEIQMLTGHKQEPVSEAVGGRKVSFYILLTFTYGRKMGSRIEPCRKSQFRTLQAGRENFI